jgi:hypothetical protein
MIVAILKNLNKVLVNAGCSSNCFMKGPDQCSSLLHYGLKDLLDGTKLANCQHAGERGTDTREHHKTSS